jgi:hypothetical protein
MNLLQGLMIVTFRLVSLSTFAIQKFILTHHADRYCQDLKEEIK